MLENQKKIFFSDDTSDTCSNITMSVPRPIQPRTNNSDMVSSPLSSVTLTQMNSVDSGLANGTLTTFKLLPTRIVRVNQDGVGRTSDTVVASANGRMNMDNRMAVMQSTSAASDHVNL